VQEVYYLNVVEHATPPGWASTLRNKLVIPVKRVANVERPEDDLQVQTRMGIFGAHVLTLRCIDLAEAVEALLDGACRADVSRLNKSMLFLYKDYVLDGARMPNDDLGVHKKCQQFARKHCPQFALKLYPEEGVEGAIMKAAADPWSSLDVASEGECVSFACRAAHEVNGGGDCPQYTVETLEDMELTPSRASNILCLVRGDGVDPGRDADRPSYLALFKLYSQAEDIDRICK